MPTPGKSLLGFLEMPAAINYLINTCVMPDPSDVPAMVAIWQGAKAKLGAPIVNAGVPAKTLQAFIALAKSRPRGYNYATPGKGSLVHLTAELVSAAAGIEMVHIPYKGMALAFPDIISGQVQVAISSALTMLPHLRGGRVHALGVTSRRRMPALPEVPTIEESGFSGFEVTQWYGMMAPAHTPRAIRLTLQQEVSRALQAPEVRARLLAEGAEPVGNTPDEFAARLKDEFAKWTKTIRSAGIKVD